MSGWHHWCDEHELGQTPEDGEGQGSLVCFSPWGHKESDMTGQLNNNNSGLESTYQCRRLWFDSWFGKIPYASKQLSPGTTITQPVIPSHMSPHVKTTEACTPKTHIPQHEKPLQWEDHAWKQRVAPAHQNYRKPVQKQQRPHTVKNK